MQAVVLQAKLAKKEKKKKKKEKKRKLEESTNGPVNGDTTLGNEFSSTLMHCSISQLCKGRYTSHNFKICLKLVDRVRSW